MTFVFFAGASFDALSLSVVALPVLLGAAAICLTSGPLLCSESVESPVEVLPAVVFEPSALVPFFDESQPAVPQTVKAPMSSNLVVNDEYRMDLPLIYEIDVPCCQ